MIDDKLIELVEERVDIVFRRFVVRTIREWSGLTDSNHGVDVCKQDSIRNSQTFVEKILKARPEFIKTFFDEFFAPVAASDRLDILDKNVTSNAIERLVDYNQERALNKVVRNVAWADAERDFQRIIEETNNLRALGYDDVVKLFAKLIPKKEPHYPRDEEGDGDWYDK